MSIVWNKVTWYSKLLALFLLFFVPLLGYFLGRLSVKVIDPEKASGAGKYSVTLNYETARLSPFSSLFSNFL